MRFLYCRSVLLVKHAQLSSDTQMIYINVTAFILNCLYLIFYSLYSEDLTEAVIKPMSMGAVVLVAMFNYIKFEDPEYVKWRYGFITTSFMVTLLAVPLLDLVSLQKTRT